jgi:hypothetical protein
VLEFIPTVYLHLAHDSYLVLTSPTRALGMNELVTIEAELRVKGSVKSKDGTLSLRPKQYH